MLNDTRCRNAKAQDNPYKLTDSKGLYLEVKPSGVKAWRYRFKLAAAGAVKESVFAIGEYAVSPAGENDEQAKARRAGRRFTLAEAREERTQARALVKQGINPAHHRQGERVKRAHEAITTVEAVADEWLALKDWAEVTKTKRREMQVRVVFPAIGALPVKQVAPAQILALLNAAAKNNGVSVMAEAKRTLYGIFEFAAETFRVDANPVHRWREALPMNKTQHKRPLSAGEVGQLLRDLAGYERNYQLVAAFRLVWLTLCRPNEVMGARWDEIDLMRRCGASPQSV
jgi:Arm DNA-binding domain